MRPYSLVFALGLFVVSVRPSLAAPTCNENEVLVDEDSKKYYCNDRNDPQLQNARLIKNATARGMKPRFQPLWDYYQHNRDVALGLAPEQNRCAIVLSMTLFLEPRSGEHTLQDLGRGGIWPDIRGKLVIPEVAGAIVAKRYYVQAQELADRLRIEWGAPEVFNGSVARSQINGRKGVIFIQNAYRRASGLGSRSGDHIDLWYLDRIGSPSSTPPPIDQAEAVWFWEISSLMIVPRNAR